MKTKMCLVFVVFCFLFMLLSQASPAQTTDFWVPLKGPEAGRIRAMAFRSTDIFVSTWGLGVLHSVDNGASWEEYNNGLQFSPIPTMEQLVLNSQGKLFGAQYSGVSRFDDGTGSWSTFNSGFGTLYPDLVGLVVGRDDILYAAARGLGIFRSSDGGENWQRCYPCVASQLVTALAANPGTNTLIAATCYQGSDPRKISIIRSIDGGINWTDVFWLSSPPSNNAIYVNPRAFAVDPRNGHFYVGVWREGIWKSEADGLIWQPFDSDLHPEINSLAVDPTTGNLYAGTEGLYQKTVIETWRLCPIDYPYYPGQVQMACVAVNPANGNIFAGSLTGAGMFRSSDHGVSWVQINKGIWNSWVRTLAMDATGRIFAGTVYSYLFRSNDLGKTWTQLHFSNWAWTVLAVLIHFPSGKIFASVPQEGLYQSTDNGDTWTHILTFPNNDWGVALISDPGNGYIYAGTTQSGVFRSTNGGGTWDQYSLEANNPKVQCLAIDSEGSIFAGTDTRGVFRSDDQGQSWESASTGLAEGYGVNCLAVSPKGYIFAGTSGAGVYRTAVKGNNWTNPAVGWAPNYVMSIAVNLEGHVFTGYSVGRSKDDGITWEEYPIAAGLRGWGIMTFVFDRNGYLYGGTDNSGIYRTAQSTLSDPVVLIRGLVDQVKSMNIRQGITNSLDAKLENALDALTAAKEGDRLDAINKLQAFINECEAQRGKALSEAQADNLKMMASAIIAILQTR